MTPPEAHPRVAGRPDGEDLGFDVAAFVLRLWRFRLVILLVTLAGGGIGFAYARSLPPRFVGTSVLNIVPAPGTGPAAETIAKFQALTGDAALIESALKEAGLQDLSPAAVRSVVTTKVGTTGTLLTVEAQWPDADIPGRISSAVARRALTVLREQWAKQAAANYSARQNELADAEQQLQKARSAFAQFRIKNRPALSRLDPDALGGELQQTLADIPAERARLKVVQDRLARIPPDHSDGSEYSKLWSRTLYSEMRLAELQARRDYLMSLDRGRPLEEALKAWSEFEVRQGPFENSMREAQQVRDQLIAAVAQAQVVMRSPGAGVELVEPSASPGRAVGLPTTAFLARGMASGFLLAVFAVFFFHGMAVNVFGRRL